MPQLLGSVLLPTPRLLAQMRFRPWNGVFLSEQYLSGVPEAEAITWQLLTKCVTVCDCVWGWGGEVELRCTKQLAPSRTLWGAAARLAGFAHNNCIRMQPTKHTKHT